MKTSMNKAILTFAAVATLGASGVANAGQYVPGWGSNPTEATDAAMSNAAKVVASRGKGCIGGKGVEPITRPVKDGDFVRVNVFISHHNGSCGIDKGFLADFERETGVKVSF